MIQYGESSRLCAAVYSLEPGTARLQEEGANGTGDPLLQRSDRSQSATSMRRELSCRLPPMVLLPYAAPSAEYPLSDLLLNKRGQRFDVVFADQTGPGVNVQTGETVLLGEADLHNRQVALQVGLLIEH